MTMIYKICNRAMWQQAVERGVFRGAEIDLQDGFIHFSSGTQVQETAAKHFAQQSDLLLIAFDDQTFGDQLKWEVSRGGDLFPHLYDTLDPESALAVHELALDDSGRHIFPASL